MTRRAALWSVLALILIAAVYSAASRRTNAAAWAELESQAAPAEGEARPVLVELFTSEGCSSCPAADRLLIRLEQKQPVPGAVIIPMGFHVDYWNHLGWRDPFSSRAYSDRQYEYSQALGLNGVYTPQMVVDGRLEFVGSDARRAASAIAAAARAPKGAVALEWDGPDGRGRLAARVHVSGLREDAGGKGMDVFLAVTESGLENSVARGENSGRRLQHTAVVRRLMRLGSVPKGSREARHTASVELDPGWDRAHLYLVAFAQERGAGRVLAVGMKPLGTP